MTTDALTRLVERTVRPETALPLQPSVPSLPPLLEARSGEADITHEEQWATADGSGSRPTAPAEGRRHVPSARDAGEEPRAPADVVQPTAGRTERPAVARGESVRPAPPDPAEPVPQAPPLPRPSREEPGQVLGRVVEHLITERTTSRRTTPTPQPASPGVAASVPTPATPPAPAAALAPAAPTADVRGAEPQPEPVISISIGRVEVRATTASPQPPGAAPARERRVMSLDDYLERRARGGRP
jgi:hypothetical protein